MLILKLILQVLAVALVLLTSTLDYVAHDKRTRRFKQFRIWLYCVAGLLLVASLVATVADDIARREEIDALRFELHRALHRIEDVGLEFVVFLPMNKPAHSGIATYTERIVPLLHAWAASLPSRDTTTWGPLSVPFSSTSPLFPDIKTERVAYTFLSHVCIGLEIFSDSSRANAFIAEAGHSQGAGDLVFLLSRSAGKTEQNDVHLGLDINNSRFSLNGVNAKTGPSKKSTGRIVSVPDLAGATAVMYFCPRGYQDEVENRELLSVANELQVVIFGLNLSGGQKVFLRPKGHMNRYGERIYILAFPKTAKEVEALIQR